VPRLLALTCAMVLIDTVFYAALVPLVPYFVEELGLSKSSAGVLSGAFGAGVLLGSAPGGYSASRLGVRPTALMGLGLMSVASLLFGFASGTWGLIVLRLAAGFGSALSWVSALTWLTAQTREERRGQMLGTLGSAAVVGALLGPVLGSAAATVGVPLAFALISVVGLAVALWASVTSAPAASPVGPFAEAFTAILRPRLMTGLLLIGFSPLLFGVLAVLAPLQLDRFGWGAAAIGAVFLVAALFEAAVHPLIGRWSDHAGYLPPVVAGLLASFAILLMLAWVPGAPLVALLVVLAGGAFNAPLVPGTTLLSRSTESVGIAGAFAFGAANFAWASGYAVGASLGGALADLGGDALSYLSLALLSLVALVLLARAV
jgi:MFS family permease